MSSFWEFRSSTATTAAAVQLSLPLTLSPNSSAGGFAFLAAGFRCCLVRLGSSVPFALLTSSSSLKSSHPSLSSSPLPPPSKTSSTPPPLLLMTAATVLRLSAALTVIFLMQLLVAGVLAPLPASLSPSSSRPPWKSSSQLLPLPLLTATVGLRFLPALLRWNLVRFLVVASPLMADAGSRLLMMCDRCPRAYACWRLQLEFFHLCPRSLAFDVTV